MPNPNRLLRLALLADAASSGAMGLLLAIGAQPLAPLLGLPAAFLQPVGFGLLPFAGFVAWVGTREPIGRGLAWTIVLVNAVWVIDSFVLFGWPDLAPTGLGHLFVVAQALAVGGLAALQALALRGRALGTASA